MTRRGGENEAGHTIGRSQILRDFPGLACISEGSLSCSVENTLKGVRVAEARLFKWFSVTQVKNEMMTVRRQR